MNADRRKEINEAYKKLEALKEAFEAVKLQAEELVGEIETIRDAEQEYFDNMPESFQQGEKGQSAEAAISMLNESIDVATEIQDFDPDIESALENLDNSTNA